MEKLDVDEEIADILIDTGGTEEETMAEVDDLWLRLMGEASGAR